MHLIPGFLGNCTHTSPGRSDAAGSAHGARGEVLLPTALPSGAQLLPQHLCSQPTPARPELQPQQPSFGHRGSWFCNIRNSNTPRRSVTRPSPMPQTFPMTSFIKTVPWGGTDKLSQTVSGVHGTVTPHHYS